MKHRRRGNHGGHREEVDNFIVFYNSYYETYVQNIQQRSPRALHIIDALRGEQLSVYLFLRTFHHKISQKTMTLTTAFNSNGVIMIKGK